MNIETKKIDIKTADGTADAFFISPTGPGPFPSVIFFIDALAVRPVMNQMAERFAAKGYAVLLPNVLYRAGAFKLFDPKTVWTDQPERDRLMGIMKLLDDDAATRDLGFWLDALKNEPRAIADKVGTTGYCLGGRLGFCGAASHPDRIGAVASIHGGGLATDAPNSPHLKANQIKARLYIGVADNDHSCSPAQQGMLVTALSNAHVEYQLELYPGAAHGFAMSDFPVYNEAAAERHYHRVFDLFESLPRQRA